MEKQIWITTPDLNRLQLLVDNPPPMENTRLESLERELQRAIVVPPDGISRRVVTMNTRVRVQDLDRGFESVLTLVFPFEANVGENRVSVLAPLGTAILGSRVGETVRFQAPGGLRRVKITGIEYQPEAAARSRNTPKT
jgi:regulator of nucleoside diphosphate kinase